MSSTDEALRDTIAAIVGEAMAEDYQNDNYGAADRIVALLREAHAPTAVAWWPIASAPTDGTPLLVARAGRLPWISSKKHGRSSRDGYGPLDGHDWYLPEGERRYPTHWCPLLVPPEVEP